MPQGLKRRLHIWAVPTERCPGHGLLEKLASEGGVSGHGGVADELGVWLVVDDGLLARVGAITSECWWR
jgi:hypothetical protein